MEVDLVNGLVSLVAAVLTLAAVAIGLFKKTYDVRNMRTELLRIGAAHG